ncbi:MAG TPA: sodium:solute symporter family protein [Pyrinomonadaceae bacterium]|nr:sodium:solute symporter family protein [Pyrinomonadaceae bacterium]
MRLTSLDVAVLIIYFVAMIGVGVYVTRRASRNLDSYFLGGKTMPWWLLGVSNASAMWDITGTMWFVYILYAYGMKAVFLPWVWPIFNQIFDAVYLSKWIRRSNARTGAEWITTRFGEGSSGELSRGIIVLFALISVVSFIGYEFQGIGKFCKVFLPWDLSPNTYAILLMSITAIYVVLGGMLSVVITDFAQFCLMALSALVIGGIAIAQVDASMLSQVTPEGWRNLFFGWDITLNWTPLLPAMNGHIAREGIASMFGLFFTVMVFKGILVSMAGAAPNYDMQRILAAKSPREASLMSAIVSICLVPRWILIGGITLLGLVFVTPEFRKMGDNIDFETVLPFVINRFLPAGLIGVLLAGLLSSFMANFSATVNAGAAYLVNDIYKKHINPEADNRKLVKFSYLGSILILAMGILLGMFLSSITQITQWIVGGLYGGYTAANILKWYWWRFNGYGYFWGMLIGIIAALVVPATLPIVAPSFHDPTYAFPVILLLSFAACIAGALLTKPVDDEVLKNFYRNVRPWGFWKPVYEKVVQEDPTVEPNRNAARDLLNCLVGIPWQLTLVTIPLYVIFRDLRGTLISLAVLISASIFLKKFWYDRLESEEGLVGSRAGDEMAPAEVPGD